MGSPFTVTVIGGGSGAAVDGGGDAAGGETSCAGAGKAAASSRLATTAADRAELAFRTIFISGWHLMFIRTFFVFIGFIFAETDTAEKVQYDVYAAS
jgi:hypothetical protein